jgi:excisionase family DNA binding protein
VDHDSEFPAGDLFETAGKPTATTVHDKTTTLPVAWLLLNSKEAAAAMGISTKTLWTLTAGGKVPCIRLGKLVRYSPAALQEWIDGINGKTVRT